MERLELQLRFYVSEEGVVLEHSSEYHIFGNRLIANALQLARLNGIEPSKRLLQAYRDTTKFAQRMLRPDGSLPLVGNTAGGSHSMPIFGSADATAMNDGAYGHPFASPESFAGSHIYPLSGYAIWWDAGSVPSQTFVAWAKHDRHGHKHADEPSVHLWSRGVDWVTATGYWPYGGRGHDEANGWQGANAPHAKGEAALSPRTVRLLGSGEAGSVRVIDIENVRETGLKVRRQIVQLASEQILVLDAVRGATAPVETLWTLDPRLTLQALGEQRFISSSVDSGHALQIDLAHDEGAAIHTALYRGSFAPFAGWVVMGNQPTPAPSLLVERPTGDSLTATLFSVNKQSGPGVFKLAVGAQADNWTIDMQGSIGVQRVQRRDGIIEIMASQETTILKLAGPPTLASQQQALRMAMSQAIEFYPQWRELGLYHQRVYMAVAGLWGAAEMMLGIFAWLRWRRAWMDLVVVIGWACVAWWVRVHYLV